MAGVTRHRPELSDALARGEEKIVRLMRDRRRTLPAKSILVEAGVEHHSVYRLRRGWAGRVRTLRDGRSQFILIFMPGDLFAVKSMFIERHPDTIEVLSEAVIEEIDQRTLKAAFDADHDIATRCTWQVMEEERRLHDWVVGLGQGSAEERTAMLLLEFRNRLIASRSVPDDAMVFDMPMTQQQLGDLLGITTVHVNRVLKGLREAGIVSIQGYKVLIGDLGALRTLAETLLDDASREGGAADRAAGQRSRKPWSSLMGE